MAECMDDGYGYAAMPNSTADQNAPSASVVLDLAAAKTNALIAGLMGLLSVCILICAIIFPGWSGKTTWQTSNEFSADKLVDESQLYTITATLSMAWATLCVEDAGPETELALNASNCAHFPKHKGSCITTDINDALMSMCQCEALCPSFTPIQDYGHAHFCDKDAAFLGYVYPNVSTMAIFALVAVLVIIGVTMAFLATREDHLAVQKRIGCCRMSQGAFSLYCVAAVFQGLGIVVYLSQRSTQLDVCAQTSTLKLDVFGYGLIIVVLAWLVLGIACHFCKLARNIQEDIPMPEEEEEPKARAEAVALQPAGISSATAAPFRAPLQSAVS